MSLTTHHGAINGGFNNGVRQRPEDIRHGHRSIRLVVRPQGVSGKGEERQCAVCKGARRTSSRAEGGEGWPIMATLKTWWLSLFSSQEYDSLMSHLQRVEKVAKETAEQLKRDRQCNKNSPTRRH